MSKKQFTKVSDSTDKGNASNSKSIAKKEEKPALKNISVKKKSTIKGVAPNSNSKVRVLKENSDSKGKIKIIPNKSGKLGDTKLVMKNLTHDFKTKNGRIRVMYVKNESPSNNIKSTIKVLSDPMCLTQEEISGQRIESLNVIADASLAANILPGGIISGPKLIATGEFVYQDMQHRKPISLRTTSNLVKDPTQMATAAKGENITSKLMDAVHNLKKPSNFTGMPNSKSDNSITITTLEETISLSIGASAFYMGISVEDNFSFSSKKYKYMYLYKFEQNCLSILADTISAPSDVYNEGVAAPSDNYYIQEVQYGRRLYVLLESEYDLEKYSNELNGSLNWGVVSGAFKQKNSGKKLSKKTNLRIISEAGKPVSVSDPAKIQSVIDDYFSKSYNQIDIAPLAFKLTNLNGVPISMMTEAFLNGKHCLDKNKIRIKIKELSCIKSDDGDNTEQVYGGVNIFLYNTKNKLVMPDGITILPKVPNIKIPTGSIVYAKENAPLILHESMPMSSNAPALKDKYCDVIISNLDMVIEMKPFMKEEDDFTDDTFVTNNKFKKSIRQMLLDGTNIFTFEFRDVSPSNVQLTMEISPV